METIKKNNVLPDAGIKLDTRCGLRCEGCSFKASHSCGGCIETMGHPFHGECPIAGCCQAKGFNHCGECARIPCEKQYAYSYADPEHGDHPPGARIEACRRCAAGQGIHAWEHVLLTSAGWETDTGEVKHPIRDAFLHMLGKDTRDAKVLFIPAAAIDDGAKHYAELCRAELLHTGIRPENITEYGLETPFDEAEALRHDVVYFTGGDPAHLLKRVKETGFDVIVKKMVCANKVYVGVSAGSLIATPNIANLNNTDTAGLALIHAVLSVHCEPGSPAQNDLPLPHIPLSDYQALAVSWAGYKLI